MNPSPGAFAPTVTQHTAGTPTTDSHGNEVPAFTDRSVRALVDWPGNSLETDNASKDQTIADVVLVLQATTAVKATDEFTLSGLRYRVLGDPARFRHPFTGSALTQVNLRRIT